MYEIKMEGAPFDQAGGRRRRRCSMKKKQQDGGRRRKRRTARRQHGGVKHLLNYINPYPYMQTAYGHMAANPYAYGLGAAGLAGLGGLGYYYRDKLPFFGQQPVVGQVPAQVQPVVGQVPAQVQPVVGQVPAQAGL